MSILQHSNTITTTSPRGRATPKFDKPFQFSQVIRPERDLIGGRYEETDREQACIDKDTLERIEQLDSRATYMPWKMGRWVHCRVQPRDAHRVVSTKYGWRVERRIPERACWHTLGHALANIPILFPSADSAIAVSEILIGDPPPEFWYFTWLRP